MKLSGRVALITGGARIGVAVAVALAERGCHVALTYRRSRAAAEETAARVRALGRTALTVRADLRSVSQARRAVQTVARRLKGLSIIVNLASTYERTPFGTLGEAAWREAIDANVTSAYAVVMAAAPFLRRQEGRVINIADWTASSGRPRYRDFLPYYTAKTAVVGLSEALALELAPRVLVNSIAPGPILAPPDLSPRANREVLQSTPLGRWGGSEAVAHAAVFLSETDFITGECVRVDGGRHLL